MKPKSNRYLEMAAELESKAREVKDLETKAAYEKLARGYRQLASHMGSASFERDVVQKSED